MSKYLLEDIVPRKNLIKIVKSKGVQDKKETKKTDPNVKNGPHSTLWFVAFVSILFCFFAVSFLFAKAEVSVNPKIQEITINEDLSADKDSNTSDLPFRLMVVSEEISKTIQATEEKDVEEKATGTVVIFNIFSTASQILTIDTRLEGSNGKIYKTKNKIIVPGIKKDGSPGSVEVNIYAEKPGAEYNSTPLDFKIFGFKGTPKYTKFYGRSKAGTEIKGGFIGKAPVVSETQKTSALLDLKNTLKAKLLQKSLDHPKEFILFKDAAIFDINDTNVMVNYNQDKSLTLTNKGTLYGILFNAQKLTKKIAENKIDKYDGSEIYIPNIQNLIFVLSNKDNLSLAVTQKIDFNLSGSIKIVWKLDVDKFITSLLGKSKGDFNQILAQYVNIDSANVSFNPFWKMSFPDQTKRIKIVVNYPQ